MGIFSIFKKRAKSGSSEADTTPVEKAGITSHNYLGKAAEAKHQAKTAVKNGKYDRAWGLLQDQKMYYMKHASRSSFTAAQILALDSEVHEGLANILRLEHKNIDALIHVLYWVIAQRHAPVKRHEQKLRAYFNRCGFENTSFEEVLEQLKSLKALPDFDTAQSIVVDWKSRG